MARQDARGPQRREDRKAARRLRRRGDERAAVRDRQGGLRRTPFDLRAATTSSTTPRLRRRADADSTAADASHPQARGTRTGLPHCVMVTGLPGPMRVASQVMAWVSKRMHPWEAAVPRTPPMLFVP